MAQAKDPKLKGGVTVSFSITPGGSVASASVASSSLGNPRVEGCLLRTFNRLKFPVADKPTGSRFPFVFKP
jgi:TonB family protein